MWVLYSQYDYWIAYCVLIFTGTVIFLDILMHARQFIKIWPKPYEYASKNLMFPLMGDIVFDMPLPIAWFVFVVYMFVLYVLWPIAGLVGAYFLILWLFREGLRRVPSR